MRRIVVAAALLTCFGATAKDLPLGGKEFITHDYKCVGVSTGRDVSMTVQEVPGAATQVLIADGGKKPVTMTLTSIDDQTRAARQYKSESADPGAEILEVSDVTGIATTTMLHSVGLEAFTSLVCNEDK